MKIRAMQVGQIGTNCYLLEDEAARTAAVVDPGGDGGRILAQIEKDGVQVCAILLTHGHFDHTEGVEELRRAYPGVPVYLHPADAALMGDAVMPAVGPTVPYGEGDTVPVGSLRVEVIHTPGHTPGGVTLRVEDALFTGDTLFQGSMGRTDLKGGSYGQLMGSLRRLGQLEGDFQVLPGHMGVSTLERERRTNYFLREALES